MIERSYYISLLEKWRNRPVIKVITGVRRCGKSTLMKMFRDKLLSEGVDEAQITSLNLEDIDNEQYLDYKTLYTYIKGRLQKDRMNYIFLDEIQMVTSFQKTIDSLQLIENVDIYVTGSNAYLYREKLRHSFLVDMSKYGCIRYHSKNTCLFSLRI
jgi:predicted AAA+ superfamily ATPase